jgi:hypothetical protein
MQSPTLSSLAAFTAFAAPVVGWYLHCRPLTDLVIALPPMCDIQFPHRRATPRRSRRQPPPACAFLSMVG